MIIPGGNQPDNGQGTNRGKAKKPRVAAATAQTAAAEAVQPSVTEPEVQTTATSIETPAPEETRETAVSEETTATVAPEETTETPAYARYAAAQRALEAAGGQTTPANSTVQNKGLPKWRKQGKSKIALIVAGVLGLAAVVGLSFWGVNADRAAKAESLAADYYNNSQQIVRQADEDIRKAETNYSTAVSYVNEVASDEGNTRLTIQTMSSDAVGDVITTMQENLYSAETSLDEAKTTYSTMITYEGQDAITVLNQEYEAKNWDKVNEIGAAIAENAAKISSLTGDINAKTNSIFESYQNLQSEASKTAQEIADNYYNVTIPNFSDIVRSDISSIEQSVVIAEGYVSSINATTADQATKDRITEASQTAKDNQALADAEFETYMALYDQLQQSYNAGNYTEVSRIGEQMIDSATKINGYAAAANESATNAASYYAEYQEAANEEYTQAVFEVKFTENDLTNPEIIKYLVNTDKAGKVQSVEQCVYNSNNGEVSMLLDCTDLFGRPYTSLIKATIATGLNRDQLTAANLVERLGQSEAVSNQVFDTAMENVAGEGSMGVMNAGQENEVSGNIEVTYSVTTSYNTKTGRTTINAQAIAVITDAEGNITYKVYSVDPVSRAGNIKVTNELREEFSNKLAQKIAADTSLQIVEENALEQ